MIDKTWPAGTLLSIARNESASAEWRKAATELLIDSGAQQANHPELRALVFEIRAERAAKKEVIAIVETANEQEVEAPNLSKLAEAIGPLSQDELDALIEQLKFAATKPVEFEHSETELTEIISNVSDGTAPFISGSSPAINLHAELQGLTGEIPPVDEILPA